MTRARDLIERLAASENAAFEVFAPIVPGGRVRTRVEGLVRTWALTDPTYEGFAIVKPHDAKTVSVVGEARPAQIEGYLARLPAVRMILVKPWRGRSWLALAWNAGDAGQRFGTALAGVPVHLVSEGRMFDVAVARVDGTTLWFHQLDRAQDAKVAADLRARFAAEIDPELLGGPGGIAGLTPEQRAAYTLAFVPTEALLADRRRALEVERVKRHVALAGGSVLDVEDRGDHWLVTFTDRRGTVHTSAIRRTDLTVLSAGICLSGRDQDFDLTSLVGVMSSDDADDW